MDITLGACRSTLLKWWGNAFHEDCAKPLFSPCRLQGWSCDVADAPHAVTPNAAWCEEAAQVVAHKVIRGQPTEAYGSKVTASARSPELLPCNPELFSFYSL